MNSTQIQQDTYLMERALQLAQTAISQGQTPFGAIVVDKNGQVVGEGHNTVRADLDPQLTVRLLPFVLPCVSLTRDSHSSVERYTVVVNHVYYAHLSSHSLVLDGSYLQHEALMCQPTNHCLMLISHRQQYG